MAWAITTWSSTNRIEADTGWPPPLLEQESGILPRRAQVMQSSLGSMSRPVVLVVALPYVGATALGQLLAQREYDVVVPNVAVGEEPPPVSFDAVLTTLPVAGYGARVVIELPLTWKTPVHVTIDGVTEGVEASASDPIGDLLDLLDRHVLAR